MIACFAWTNLQILNITNAKVNIYGEEKADLYVRTGPHMSKELIAAVKNSGVFENVYIIDPIVLNYKHMPLGFIKILRVFLLRRAYQKAFDALLEHTASKKNYSRAMISWFYAENAFVIDYFNRNSDKLAITLVEEGTGSYCYTKKQLAFSLFGAAKFKDKVRLMLSEGFLARRLAKKIDTTCMYRPEYAQPDIDYKKIALPQVLEDTNPVVYGLLNALGNSLDYSQHIHYNKRRFIYFTVYSQEGSSFDNISYKILDSIIDSSFQGQVAVKVHTNNSTHAQKFAVDYEDRIYVDRNVYIFESLYTQLEDPSNKVLISCASTAAFNPKFMFNHEPYVIFTYRLYNTYRQIGVERDDWMADALLDAYEDKSRILIPNSIIELQEMIRNIYRA